MGDHSQSSAEEVISIDECAAIGQGDPHSSYSTIPLSKKAIHQRDADENLFLRFLELDPVLDPATASSAALAAAVASSAIANSASDQRRKSTYRPTTGRTPFTISKRLVRSSDKGFGFSIVWTHPPRIEKVEKGLSADQAGIIAGDFLIFVDKDNVVTMPEIDILNLIRSQGNTLNIEIFRRSTQMRPSNGTGSAANANFMRRSSITFSNNQMMVEQATSKQVAQQQQLQQQQEPRPSTACSYDVSVSVDNTKRSLKLPQVTFSKDVSHRQHISNYNLLQNFKFSNSLYLHTLSRTNHDATSTNWLTVNSISSAPYNSECNASYSPCRSDPIWYRLVIIALCSRISRKSSDCPRISWNSWCPKTMSHRSTLHHGYICPSQQHCAQPTSGTVTDWRELIVCW